MSDDQGWGDVAYNGNQIIHTPSLDDMANEAVKLDRFYAASPVCSPTRGSVLTGRHPFRYGIEWAGAGHMPSNELTIAEVLADNGYQTGHFGKWHVGELSKTVNQSYFKGELANPDHYSPPWENGFHESFSTESMMPTYNPYYYQGGKYGQEDYRHLQKEPVALGQKSGGFRWRDYYWTGPGQIVDEWLEGDDSEIVMDRAISFINNKVANQQPFFATIWFHTPHTPLVAGNDDRTRYAQHPIQAQHFYGSITAMDRQIGRLRDHLKQLKISDNTIVWFKSDNGPSYIHNFNSTGPFSGKKAELKEGGIRVPAIIEWPNKLNGGQTINTPMSTMDIYPTILAALNISLPSNQPTLDGENIIPILTNEKKQRAYPIAFQSPMRGIKYDADNSRLQYALSGEKYKLYSGDNGETWQLFDITSDPAEAYDISSKHPNIVTKMKSELDAWRLETKEDAMDANKN
ncbi:N-acetylgalactosamine-6-sulfatase [Shewanella sp. MBTL60-007]|nr:N-acetylgalactosamine-6-sulfatase [Shewanella sp. MBTL60-007]